jgi:sugar transferase (PEP-CTERM system associated)
MIRVFRHYLPRSLVILGAGEAVILIAAIYVSVSVGLLEINPTARLLVGPIWTKALAYLLIMMLIMAAAGLYQRGLREEPRGMALRIGVAMIIGSLIMATLGAFILQLNIGKRALIFAFAFSFVGVSLFRILVYRYLDTAYFKRRVLVLGAGELAAQVERLRRRSDWQDMLLLGYVPIPGEYAVVSSEKLLPIQSTLRDLARELRADEIVVAIGDRRRHFPIRDILDCKMDGIQIVDVVGFFERQTGRINVDALNPSTMVFADGFIQAVLKTYVHRVFDLLISISVLIITLPIMLVAAILIWLESRCREPVLYRQTRVGRNGKLFRILKVRTMSVDAEASGGARWAVPGDTRITAVGGMLRNSRIDELPQLINVLKGDMSFVGPRPERPEFVDDLVNEIPFYDLRHRVNPGITGWAQICYPYGASSEDAQGKLEYDLYYIKNYSLFLDLMILIQTVQVILWGKGAR